MPRYVVQHHWATADHYDVRLELDGVLVSWAVPKGPSLDAGVRRLAKRVGDHDLDYGGYEGVLSPQRRGGGVVQLWDHGTWRQTSETGLADGHLSFELDGEKLRGGFSLIRTRGDGMWLLLKKRDAHATSDDVTVGRPLSVLTGRTMIEIESDG